MNNLPLVSSCTIFAECLRLDADKKYCRLDTVSASWSTIKDSNSDHCELASLTLHHRPEQGSRKSLDFEPLELD